MARSPRQFALDEAVKVLDRIPILGAVKDELTRLRALLYDRRTPRLAVIGLPKSGRSSLLRALIQRGPGGELRADHDAWVRIAHESAKVDWLEMDLDDAEAGAHWRMAVADKVPDVVLVTLEPADIDRAEEILRRSEELLRALPQGQERPRLFPLLTQSDLIGTGERDAEALRRQFTRVLRGSKVKADPPRAVSSLTGQGLQGLSEAIVLAVPDEARVEAARSLTRAHEARVRLANDIVRACTSISMTVGVTPIPFSDMAILGPVQALMVSSITYLSGRQWNRKTAAEWFASLGVAGTLAFGMRYTAQTMLKFIPIAGNLVSAGFAAGGTNAMGRSAIKYFMRSAD